MATYCVGPAAIGTGSGADWNNLKAWTDTPVRGDTWYLVDGNYTGKTFSVATSGATLITIKKATIADHAGIATGWVNSLGNGSANFNSQIKFTTSYWVFDGQEGGGPGGGFNGWTTGFGFQITDTSTNPVVWFNGCGNITFQHAELKGNLATDGGLGNDGFRCAKTDLTASGSGLITVRYCSVHNVGRSAIYHRDGPMLFEYRFLGVYSSTGGEPCPMVELRSDQFFTFRFGITTHYEGLGGFLCANNSPANSNTTAEIYGNVFFNSGVTTWVVGGQGFIGSLAADAFMLNWKLYNNSFVNFPATLDVFGDSGESPSGCVAANNYFYATLLHHVDTGWTENHDHFQDSGTATGSNTSTGTGNPFVDYPSYDFGLTADTAAGATIAAPYDVDMLAEARGADGVWTRGAIEFVDSGNPPPVGGREQYGVSETGVSLYWVAHLPTTPGPWPAIIHLHPGGYKGGGPDAPGVTSRLAAAGFLTLATEYRLAPPGTQMTVVPGGHESPGQDTVGDPGHYPAPNNDVALAIRTARADPRCNGTVGALGGSAGAALSSFMAGTGTPGDDMPDLAVIMSCGVSNMFDPNLWVLPNPGDETDPAAAVANHLNIPNTRPNPPTGADLVTAQAASTVSHLHLGMPPMWVMCSSKDSLGIPTSTGVSIHSYNTDGSPGPLENGANGLIPALLAIGMTESTADFPEIGKFKQTVYPVTDHTHAFEGFNLPFNGVSGETVGDKIIAWFLAGVPSSGGGGGTPDGITKGAVIGTGEGAPINPDVLASPAVDGVSLNAHWSNLEPSEDNYDWTYLDTEIRRAAAAGKKVTLRPTTMAGSEFFGGNTPDWVFTAIKNAPGGDLTLVSDCVTNSTKVVTSATADFTSHDLHSPVTGSDMPFAPTYVGTVVNPTTIWLSSSPTSQVDVNATGSHTGLTLDFQARPGVNAMDHDVVWGHTYDYIDPNPNHGGDPQTTIPVFWDPTFLEKKKALYNAIGDHITNGTTLTPVEKAAVTILAISFANAQTEDWNVPHSDTLDGDNTLTQVQRWMNSPTDPNPDLRGAGYTTQKMIDAAIKRADFQGTDGQTYTSTRFTSATANFTFADVGKEIRGTTGGIDTNTLIAAWVSKTEVQLDKPTTATASAVQFTIRSRDMGLFDVAIAAFPGRFITSAYAGNGLELDLEASNADGYDDPNIYLAYKVTTLVNAKYPGHAVAQKNALTAKIPTAPGTGPMKLLYDIHVGGNYVAFQDLAAVYGDPLYRMNGGVPGDYETISNNCSLKAFSYGASYREMYPTDVQGIPGAIQFCHDLLNPSTIEPPPPEPDIIPPLTPGIVGVQPSFRDGVLYAIADLLAIDPEDLSPGRARRLISKIQYHLNYAWNLANWPQLILSEERAFRRIWNDTELFALGDEFYWLGNAFTDPGYYRTIFAPPVSGIEPTDETYFAPFTLEGSDYYISLLQRCRRRLGSIIEVYPSDPRDPTLPTPKPLPWRLSTRGLEVFRFGGLTVFVDYRIVPYIYTGSPFVPTAFYKASGLALNNDDGEVYRRIVAGADMEITPGLWALVPFPGFLAPYVVYMVAAEEAPDLGNRRDFRAQAQEFLARAQDELVEVGVRPARYRLSWSRPRFQPQPATFGTAVIDAENTISDLCLNEWGDVVPLT